MSRRVRGYGRGTTSTPGEGTVPLQPDVQYVSVDDHLLEPPDLWTSRLPAALVERGPRLVETTEDTADDFGKVFPAGSEAWLYDGAIVTQTMGMGIAGVPVEERGRDALRYEVVRPGCWSPKDRLVDMDADGVQVQCCFPTFPRFAGTRFVRTPDRALAQACVRAYNDFVLDEWCATDPARLVALGILPLWDLDAAVAEVHRLAARGARAIAFSENPAALGLPSMWTDHWEPLWSAIDETQLVVCCHIGSSGRLLKSSDDAPPSMVLPHMGANSMIACTDWLFTGVLDRHRSIRVAFSEGGAGWVPYLLEQSEKIFARAHFRAQFGATRPPREVFAEQMVVCFMCDDTALAAIDVIGEDNMTWESDYPHEDGFFPHSRARLVETLAAVPEPVARKIAETNARRVFRI